ncbi:MAG: SsrA-binding protein SmpB [Alphaproteobacteria bacterium]
MSNFISTGLVAQNRKARFNYEISEIFIAGLELTGTEVKSLRLGHANINDAFGIDKDGELFVSNMYIREYEMKGYQTHEEMRPRKLLLKKKEIIEIINEIQKKGATLVAMKVFFNDRGKAKIELGIGKGKKLYDKRETIKERDWNKQKQRLMMGK